MTWVKIHHNTSQAIHYSAQNNLHFNFNRERATRTMSTHWRRTSDLTAIHKIQASGINSFISYVPSHHHPSPQVGVRQQICRKLYNQISSVNKHKLINVTYTSAVNHLIKYVLTVSSSWQSSRISTLQNIRSTLIMFKFLYLNSNKIVFHTWKYRN